MSLSSSAAHLSHLGGRLWGGPVRYLVRSLLPALLRFGALVVVGLVSLSLVAWLIFHWGILPRLDDWRPRVETVLSQRLGITVQIGRMQARSSAWVPAFTLNDVVLRDPAGREALRLPQVAVALSVPSLLAMKLRFAQVLVDGAQLEVRRDVRGHLLVAGLDLSAPRQGDAGSSSAAADWLFEQGEFVFRGGQLRWVDEQRQAPALALQDVQLVLRNRGLRHALRLDATPPPDWGERFSLRVLARQPLLSRQGLVRASDWRRWSGSVYVELPRVDTAQLRRHVELPVDLQQGRAALRAWLDWDQAQPLALTLDAQLRDVRLRLARRLAPLDLADAGLRLVARQRGDQAELELNGLHFRTREGQTWAPSQLALQWQWAPGRPPGLLASPGPAAAAAPNAVDALSTRSAESDASATPPVAAASMPNAAWPVLGGSLRADRLDLAPLATLAERLPLSAGARQLLARLGPEGTVNQLEATWQGLLDAPSRYTVRAALRGTAIAAAPSPEPDGIGRPGWRGADLDLQATEAGGQAALRLADGQMSFPGIFAQPQVAFQRLSAQLKWRITPAANAPPAVALTLSDVRFANADVEGTLAAAWQTGPGTGFGQGRRFPGVLTLDGRIARGQATSVARYLPLGIGAPARDWVRHAVQGGEVHGVDYRVQGDLWAFPYVNRNEGEFRVSGQVRDLVLAPVPSVPALGNEPAWTSPWPAFANVSGQLVFERNAMRFSQTSGRLWGLTLSGVSGGIRELSTEAVVEVQGQVRGPAHDLLRYVNKTPIGDWIGQGLAQTRASGPAQLDLALSLPLAHLDNTTLKGELQLAGNDVRLGPDLPLLANARGPVAITQRGVQLNAVRAQVLGGEAQVDGGSQADGSLRFAVAGTATADALRRTTEWPVLPALGQHLQGQATYRLQLGLVQGLPEFTLTSNLQGMAIKLPVPLAKPAGTVLPLRVQTRLQPESGGGPAQRDSVRVSLGALQLGLLRGFGGTETQVLRSALSYDSALPEPVPQGRAVLKLPAVDGDAWRAVWASAGEGAPPPLAGPAGGAPALGPVARPVAWPLPASVRLETPELRYSGRRLSQVVLELQQLGAPQPAGWRADVQAEQTRGTLEMLAPQPGQPGQAGGLVRARLARLVLPPAEADQVSGLLDQAPANMPALDIEVEQFQLRGLPLGRLQVLASNQPASAGRAGQSPGSPRTEWRLDKLQLHNTDARFDAKGRWLPAAAGQGRRVVLDFELGIDDGGRLLERLGFGRLLTAGNGSLRGQVGWEGSPLALDLPTLDGQVTLAMSKGRFLKVDPGAARLLGVLSLQALPRRLVLDFRDLFQEGFAFDDITGDLTLHQGVVRTQNLQMRGLQAAVFLAGDASIAAETQDLRALVLPELNTVSASLAYAAINPVAGLGALMAQWLLREPIRQASAREFHITGSWTDPQVSRVARKLTDPLPAAAQGAPPSAAASGPGLGAAPASAPILTPTPTPTPAPTPAPAPPPPAAGSAPADGKPP